MTCLVDDPTERAGSIRTREDVLIHEEAPRNVSVDRMSTRYKIVPDEILILP